MKTTNHTPGSWAVTFGKYDASIHTDVTISRISDEAHAWKANAHLIASAPDLLSALIALEKASREVLDTSATHDGLENCKTLLMARIAIQKARGEA